MRRVIWLVVGGVVLVAVWLSVRDPGSSGPALLSRDEVATSYPALREARTSTTHGAVRVVGRRCGLVPNESGGRGQVFAGARGATRRFDGAQGGTTVVETTARLSSTEVADAFVLRYRDYLRRCAGRTFGGDWEGTVTSTGWRLPGVGDAAVGMLDRLDDRGGPSVQRVAIVRKGSRVVVLQVVRRDVRTLDPGVALRLLRSAVRTG